jgi:hypothetical protein
MSERWGKSRSRRLRRRQPQARNVGGYFRRGATPILDPCPREGQRGQIRVHSSSQSPSSIPSNTTSIFIDTVISRTYSKLMESPLHQVWESAVGNPFVPTVGKGSQFFLGFTLLTIGLLLSGLFGLSAYSLVPFMEP